MSGRQWITADDIAKARQDFIDAIPGWRAPTAHGVAFVPGGGQAIAPGHFPLVNTAEHLLPAAVLATVVGHTAGSAAYALTPQQLDEAIALIEPAEASTVYEHPNLWRWRDHIRPAWQRDPDAQVIAVYIGDDAVRADDHPAVTALRSAAAERALPWRQRLRALPTFDGPLPRFTPEAAPDDPRALFDTWLRAAIAEGVHAPHAATLATADAGGGVSARTLVLKDVDERGWWFASRTDGRKARDVRSNPRAAMTFFWREHGRQVRLSGRVMDAGRAAADADFLARPVHSRAAAIIGEQSTPLPSRAEYVSAFDSAQADVAAHPDRTSDTWAAFILQPLVVEFWATTADTGHVRLEYRRNETADPWRRGLLWP
ncbi:pyridoxine/pyridoxamine 5'-phosphate oxidase [Microbacterium invictum]|uniref:Pyridoxine/pyridoxamine 5'-phosphate oxidase n=1 Tax=Microbacterium invictum TaxID=515415 RepID=A0AA40SNQ8_9MICO|nr:pyridoxal 5'-phosphate synthase [Microbacterium invictum]MBB4139482.1 pyridoxine/pyridoxamine 5'-phosphate oxidase [Microbacterium invictum]